MRLHRNIALNLAVVVAGLILILYLLSTFVLMSEFTSLENRQAQEDMEQVFSAYRAEEQDLEGITRDWSSWDDTYAFIETASPDYLTSNMVDGTFVNNRLNIALYFNRSGGLLYGKSFDYRMNEGRDIPPDLIAALEAEGIVRSVIDNDTGRSEIIRYSDGALLFSAMPILTSENRGPARGVLVMGRSVDANMIRRFEQVTSLPLEIVEISSLPPRATESYPDLSPDHPYTIIPMNESQLNGYLFLNDVRGSPELILQASIPRDFFAQGIALTRFFFSLLIVVAIAFGTIVMVIMERDVLSRIATLNMSVSDIEKSGDLTRRVPEQGDDEIAEFSQEINRMLAAMMRAESAIGMQNRQLTAANEIIHAVSHSTTSDEIFSSSLQKTIDTLGFEMGAIFSTNLEMRKAELKAHSGISPKKISAFLAAASTIDIHRSPHEKVFTAAVPMYYGGIPGEELDEKKNPILTSLGVRSLAIIPLAAGSAMFGVMYAGWTVPHTFTEYEKGILTTIGQEVGNALFKGVLQEKLVAAMTRADISNERAEKARDEANFYLDIMTHDINNVNQASLGYLMLLNEPEESSQDDLIRKLENTVHKSSEIIGQVSVIRRIREKDAPLKRIDLDRIIRDVVHHYADARIVYKGTTLLVHADELIPEIFMNLVGNAIKFGGSENTITIDVQSRGDEVEITVRDTGQGIPDALKPVLFQKYRRGTTAKSGKGLGLYIVRMLVERYGGRVWVEDAEAGSFDRGAAVKFTLKGASEAGSTAQ
ncbi:MAG: ATP-binding protein [Methanomicrobiales archaeon]|nr:ATP-binding protein [Methanomicrobiales archaeon]